MDKEMMLVSWIGHTDLKVMARDLDESRRERVRQITRNLEVPEGGRGPLRTLLDQEPFAAVWLLSDYDEEINDWYRLWLGRPAEIVPVRLANPADYREVFVKSREALAGIVASIDRERHCLAMLLTSGTPTMAATWMLLGKTHYPATFYQTYQGRASVADIPYDIQLDFLPELFKGTGALLAHLTALRPGEVAGFEQIVGESLAIRRATGQARQAGVLDVPVVLTGESGTGKELFARAIHRAGPRRDQPFEPVNCAALPLELLESILFGHKKGAFTGAINDKDGLFKLAGGGTIFLDEIGESDPAFQAKLLRVLQPPQGAGPTVRQFTPVGGAELISSDVQIIAATNRNLLEEVAARRFREDLYYRLAAVTIHLPPLRERVADIPLLAEAWLEQLNQRFASVQEGFMARHLTAGALALLKKLTWPGNIRQLHNVILQATVMAGRESIEAEDIQAALGVTPAGPKTVISLEQPLGDGFCLDELLRELRGHYFHRAWDESGHVKKRMAEMLGYENWQTMDKQMKGYELG